MIRTLCLLLTVLMSACASAPAAPPPDVQPAPPPAVQTAAPAAAASDGLPEGPGRAILTTACTVCHGLAEVETFRGFYGRDQWRSLIVTMVAYGAEVDETEVEVLADYLAEHLGPR